MNRKREKRSINQFCGIMILERARSNEIFRRYHGPRAVSRFSLDKNYDDGDDDTGSDWDGAYILLRVRIILLFSSVRCRASVTVTFRFGNNIAFCRAWRDRWLFRSFARWSPPPPRSVTIGRQRRRRLLLLQRRRIVVSGMLTNVRVCGCGCVSLGAVSR